MILRVNGKDYEVAEFQYFIQDNFDERLTSTLDVLVDIPLEEIERLDFSLFIIITDTQTHVFSNYEILEYYKDNETSGLTKIVLTK